MLAERAEPQKDLFFFCLFMKKETGGRDVHRCVITQHVYNALTNLIRDWAAKTPAPYSTSWCDETIITQDYPELPSLCLFPLSFPAAASETAANSAGWQRNDSITKKTTAVEDTVNENYRAACQGITQTVPYYSVFQQLVICLISVLESNRIIIKTKTDRQREKGSVWSFFKWNVCFFFFKEKNIGGVVAGQQGNSSPAPHASKQGFQKGSSWQAELLPSLFRTLFLRQSE